MTRSDTQHVLRGLHSRIPICCIAYFVTTYLPRWRSVSTRNRRYVSRHISRNHAVARELGERPPGYVPCPACIRARRFVRVHMCTARCHGYAGAEDVRAVRLRQRRAKVCRS